MRNAVDHVFVDCGRIGLADRGGHGHNDCLSFEAVLDGVRLVSDCGSFVYTRSFEERNRFRSTASHNTPIVDGQEINRLRPELLWDLEYDAKPELRRFETSDTRDVFVGAHAGYRRLAEPVTPVQDDRARPPPARAAGRRPLRGPGTAPDRGSAPPRAWSDCDAAWSRHRGAARQYRRFRLEW